MGIIIIDFYGGGLPFAASNDLATYIPDVDMSSGATGSVVTFTTPNGGLEANIIVTGGSGSYTFSWSISKTMETSDTGSRFSVNSTGATNTSTFSPTIDGARGSTSGDVFEAEFLAACVVSDGVASPITVNVPFMVIAVAL